MSKSLFIFCSLFLFFKLHAQVENDTIDTRYLEDQIYLSLTYNILVDKPTTISQNGFSGGVSVGFIKDLPINKQRNFGFGIGVGYAYNAYIQNLKISQTEQITIFQTAKDFKTNRLTISALEFPIELRWRNSTPQKYKFWRVYGGLKISYIISAKTKFRNSIETLTTKNIAELNRIQYGLILSTGFSTWDLYIYYGMNKFFKEVEFNEEKLILKDFNVGVKFYIM